MNFEYYISKRITFQSKRSFSKTVVRIAIAAIMLSVAVMLVSVSILRGFQTEIKDKIVGFGSHIQITHTKLNYTYENVAIEYDKDIIRQIRQVDGVSHVNVFATKAGIIKTKNDIEGIVLKGIDKNYNQSAIESYLVSGTAMKFPDSFSSNDILVSQSLCSKLKLDTGDFLELYFVQDPPRVRKLKIKGTFSTGLEEVDETFAICDLRHIQKLNRWDPNQIGGLEVHIADFNQLNEVNDIIRLMLPLEQDSKTILEIYPQLFDWLSLLDKNVIIILFLMIAVGTFNMITALLIIILEKTQMIGILKSFGANNFSISKIFLYNAAFLILAGLALGNVLALGFLYAQHHWDFIKMPTEYYFIDSVPILFSWGYFGLVNLGTFIVCSLILVLPALFVSRIDPVRAIRFE